MRDTESGYKDSEKFDSIYPYPYVMLLSIHRDHTRIQSEKKKKGGRDEKMAILIDDELKQKYKYKYKYKHHYKHH